MIDDNDRLFFFFASVAVTKPIEEDIENPATSVGVRSHAGRMENLGSQVSSEETPRGAVRSGADVVLVAGDDSAEGCGGWTIGENGAVRDEGLVSEGTIGDEDGGTGGDAEGDDRAEAVVDGAEVGAETS